MGERKDYIGWMGATRGDEVYVNTLDNEPVTLTIKNHDKRWKMYSTHVRITVETISPAEFEDWKKHMKLMEKKNAKP